MRGLLLAPLLLASACSTDQPPSFAERATISAFAGMKYPVDAENEQELLGAAVGAARERQQACRAQGATGRVSDPANTLDGRAVLSPRKTIDAIVEAQQACKGVASELLQVFGDDCVDVGEEHRLEKYQYSWRSSARDQEAADAAEEEIASLYGDMLTACLASATHQAYAGLGLEPPAQLPVALLFGGWIDLCTNGLSGDESSSWYGAFFESDSPGDATVLGSAPFLWSALIAAGADSSDALRALMDGYRTHHLRCPTVAVQERAAHTGAVKG